MNNLAVIKLEHKNQRVLTTMQLAEFYETDIVRISQNYTRNINKYREGIHNYKVEGEELKAIKADYQIDIPSNVNSLMLWTEKGALLHAKSLNTDKAWEVYGELVDTYFKKQQPIQLDSKFLFAMATQLEEKEKQILIMKPKAEFFDAVADSKTAIEMSQAAKVLNFGKGRNTLFSILREEGVLRDNNEPYQCFIDRGCFRVVEQKFQKPDGTVSINIKTLVYQKGLDFIKKTLDKRKGA